MIHDTDDMLIKIREDIAVILKDVDEFVAATQKAILEREAKVTEEIKKYVVLEAKEKKLSSIQKDLKTKESVIEKQKLANREKQEFLEKKEVELEEKLKKLQTIVN